MFFSPFGRKACVRALLHALRVRIESPWPIKTATKSWQSERVPISRRNVWTDYSNLTFLITIIFFFSSQVFRWKRLPKMSRMRALMKNWWVWERSLYNGLGFDSITGQWRKRDSNLLGLWKDNELIVVVALSYQFNKQVRTKNGTWVGKDSGKGLPVSIHISALCFDSVKGCTYDLVSRRCYCVHPYITGTEWAALFRSLSYVKLLPASTFVWSPSRLTSAALAIHRENVHTV